MEVLLEPGHMGDGSVCAMPRAATCGAEQPVLRPTGSFVGAQSHNINNVEWEVLMHTLSSHQMTDIEGGGLLWCGLAMGVTGLGGFFSRMLAKYFSGLPLGCVDAALA